VKEKQQLAHLYHLYLTNKCTAEELELLFGLLNKSKDDKAMYALLSDTWDQTEAIPDTDLVPDFLPPPAKLLTLPAHTHRLRWLVTAAAVVLLVLGGLYLFKQGASDSSNALYQQQIVSTKGERRQLQLADGTKVWLSPNSTLRFPGASSTGNHRLVNLTGEAFFEVASDVSHPFIITAGKVSTTVLGTSFNISAYTQQPTIHVTLVTGKVAVALGNNNARSLTMLPNQQITVDKTTDQLTKADFPDAASFLDKRLGLYEYKGTMLREVIKDLETQYAIQVQVGENLSDHSFYGNLNMTESIEQTLNKLSTVMEIQWKRNGGQYVITK
jgi:ferric-dicitrate binding protein FerR (iron transport regulator)